MSGNRSKTDAELSRRAFLRAAGGVLASATTLGLGESVIAGSRHPKRRGMLRFATRGDASGLDPHRNTYYLVSNVLAATSQGLLDLNLRAEPVPGIATEWTASKDLLTYTFRLRQGVLFHNGQEVDAEAIRWNYARIKDPNASHAFMRATLGNLKEIVVVDKYTLQCRLHRPSAAFPAKVVYYPCNLIAPGSVDRAHLLPVGCGPFKFVNWDRDNVTELKRFEYYFETDTKGNSLPYLDGIVGRPKKADQVRLTALRTGEVDLIDTMSYSAAADFPQRYGQKFQSWAVPVLGTSFLVFNLDAGPFADKRVRLAVAHAIDREAIKDAVFYGQGEIARCYYAATSPWYAPNTRPYPAYDPDKARFLLRQARATGAEIELQSSMSYAYLGQTGELIQAMLTDVGLRVRFLLDGAPVLRRRRRDRKFHMESTSASYRFDPDSWFGNVVLSTSPTNRTLSGFHNARADRLIMEARQTADKQKRLELYGEIESIINEEVPLLYLHHITLLEAGARNLQDYQPGISGAFSTRGAGIRTAWLA